MKKPNAAVALAWRQMVLSPQPWRRCANQAGAVGSRVPGEAGGYFVESDLLPRRRGYLKPTIPEKGSHRSRAAREKIAADLAHDFGVNVPPVLLWENVATPDQGETTETHTCVSLVLNAKQWAWGTVEPLLEAGNLPPTTEALLSDPLSSCAAALAFDYWLGQPDHDHDSNIMFGYEDDGADGEYIFLDYAFAMGSGGRWGGGRWQSDFTVGFPPRMLAAVDRGLLHEAVTKIEGFSDAALTDVIMRIPRGFLPRAEQTLILKGLLERRHLVRDQLNPILRGKP